MKRACVAVSGLVALAAGCAVGPDYERPELNAPVAMPEVAAISSAETGIKVTQKEPVDRWWEVWKDPQLTQLVEEAKLNNQDLRAAIARVHQARALVRQAFAPLLPNVGANGQYQYQKQSTNAFIFPATGGTATGFPTATGVSLRGEPFELWSGSADLSYELDLWGRIRRGLEAAQAQEAATENDKHNVEITVASEVAQAYFDLGQAEVDLDIAQEAVVLREKTLALVKGRFDAGLAAELELRRAESELASTRGQVPEFERRRAVAMHRLAILTGRVPDLKFSGRAPAAFELPPEIPVGLPATLLERRPDLRAAEQRLRASNARIGEAIANFFPRVTIGARLGYASIDAGTLTSGGSQLWSLGPAIRIPLFEGGQTYARYLETEAARDEATAQFYQTFLRALGEVADALVGIDAHVRVRDRQREAVVASQRAVELATIEYDQGLTSYLQVLDSQRTLLGARQALLQTQRQVLFDMVTLQKALGGGWTEIPDDDAIVPTKG